MVTNNHEHKWLWRGRKFNKHVYECGCNQVKLIDDDGSFIIVGKKEAGIKW